MLLFSAAFRVVFEMGYLPYEREPSSQFVKEIDGGRSMYLPAEWGPRTRETTLLSDSATTTRRAGLSCVQMGSPED